MLQRLSIKNYALIEELEIDFETGLQVITGETGAGKSILLGAIRLILGERADLKAIGDETKKCIIEAVFQQKSALFNNQLLENELEVEEDCTIRRELLPNGKTRAFVNDSPVRLDVLQQISSVLIDVHSQFDTAQLLTENYQFDLIDGLLTDNKMIVNYQQQYLHYKKQLQQLQQLKERHQQQNNQNDYDLFLLSELQEMSLEKVDFHQLQEQLSVLENADYILENLSGSLSLLQDDQRGMLLACNDLMQRLGKISQHQKETELVYDRVVSVLEELKDINLSLESQMDKVEMNPNLLIELQATYNKIQLLIQKHQAKDFTELLQIQEKLAFQLNNTIDAEQQIAALQQAIVLIEKDLDKQAGQISNERKKVSPIFQENIENTLVKLGLEKAKIAVELTPSEQYNLHGKEHIQLMFQANLGYPMKPIQTAISGGERSRVMLAIKALMAENQNLGTLVLDEIDTGVSGRVAEEMGNKMKEMASNRQLIVITHLAQVAAKGNTNYIVKKHEVQGKTQTTIIPLGPEEKLQEIAQLLSGNQITEEAYRQAKVLISS